MEVIVFGMENCAGCVTVKNVLNTFGVKFKERDVMNPDHMVEAQEHGVRSVPSTFISYGEGAEEFIVGSQPAQLAAIRKAVGV